MATFTSPLVDALYRTDGKAEIVNGKIVRRMATGRMPSYAAFALAVSLRHFAKWAKLPGIVVPDNAEMAAKRRDYFAAGSLVVWDVDLLAETAVVRKYTVESGTDRPAATFRRDETADAEPAVPGWAMPVNELFED